MSDRGDRVRAIVQAVLERPDADRAAYVDAACGDDDALRREVEALMPAGLAADPVPSPVGEPSEPEPSLAAGTRLASYRIVRRIGAGATGRVYEAEQERTNRRVALKTMNADLLSEASLRRFSLAVEVLASLRHPGIAQVHESGLHTFEGGGLRRDTPWFAMEYVGGARPLLDYAREHQLGIRARLRLLLQVCEAVEHGHRKGVVHRDLKPGSLLVDPAGRVKVIDFGLARVLDADRVRAMLRANADAIVGRLPYLSPEQLSGAGEEVDTRTDVYALGVVGYELLVGCLPIDVSGQTVGRAVRKSEELGPVRPSRHDPELKGGVEAILLKALERDPKLRYGSVDTLGGDIRRYLGDQAVLAHPPSTAYELRTFASRNRMLVGAVLAFFLVALSAAVVSYQHARRSRASEQVASARATEALAEQGRARLVLEQLLERSTRSAMEFAPMVQRLRGGPGLASAMMQRTLADLQLVERMSSSDPRVRVALASAYTRFGDAAGSPSEANLGDLAAADRSFAHALELVAPILAADPAHVPARWAAVRALQGRGEVLLARREHEQGMHLLRQALEIAEGLRRDVPDELTFQAALAGVQDRLGAAYGQAGDVEQAEENLANSRAGFARLVEQAPHVPLYRHHHALGFQQAAAAAWSRGGYEAARDGFAQAAYLLEPLVQRYGQDRRHLERLAWNVMWTGSAEQQLGHLDVAQHRIESALGLYRSLGEADLYNRKIPPLVGNALWSLGTLAQDRAQAADADAEARRKHLEAALGWFEEAESNLVGRTVDGVLDARAAQRLDAIRQRIGVVRAMLARDGDGGG